jgi:hypothetical protein
MFNELETGLFICYVISVYFSMGIFNVYHKYTINETPYGLWLFLVLTPILNIIVMCMNFHQIKKWKKEDEDILEKVVDTYK